MKQSALFTRRITYIPIGRMASMKRKKPTGIELELINLKVTPKEHKQLRALAAKHTSGNLSAWLRIAGANHIPRKKELTEYDGNG